MRLYSAKIYDSGTLVRNFIPCKNDNNVVGLYDLVNDVFYRNAGTGTFTAGNEVSFPNPDYPQDIKVVKGRTCRNLFNGELSKGYWSSTTALADTTSRSFRSFKINLPAGTYTISFQTAVNIVRQIADGNLTQNIGNNITKYTLTTQTDGYVGFSFRITGETQTDWDNSNIMFQKGSTATPYEPYFEGKRIGIKTCHKNIFYGEILGLWYASESGKFFNTSSFKSVTCKVKPNTQYTISKKNASNRFALITSEEKPQHAGLYSRILISLSNSDRTQYSFTTQSNENYIFFGVYNGTDEVEIAKAIEEIQLEEGTTATQYEPYREKTMYLNIGNMEFCGTGDVADTFFKNVMGDENYNAELDEGAWYKYEAIAKISGSDNFTGNGITTDRVGLLTPALNIESDLIENELSLKTLCNLLQTSLVAHTGLQGTTSTSKIRIYLNLSYATDYNEAKEVLKDIIIYYVQANPTYQKITDEQLIEQLDQLQKIKMSYGVNHIWTEIYDELEPNLQLDYFKSNRLRLDNIEARLELLEE